MRTLLLASMLGALAVGGCGGGDSAAPEAPVAADSDTRALDAARAALNVGKAGSAALDDAPAASKDLAVEPLEELDETARLRRDRAKAARYEVERQALAELERAQADAQKASGSGDAIRLTEGIDE